MMRFRQFVVCITVIVLVHLLGIGTAFAEDNNTANSQTAYQVKVEVKEVQNRIVEGKVRNHTIRIDQPKEFGADDSAPTPPETLAFALGSCFVSAGRLIAIQRQLDIKSIEAMVESELDFAKALGMPTEKRAGFDGFKITVSIDAEMTVDEKNALIAEIASRCPMCDNLMNPTPLAYELAK